MIDRKQKLSLTRQAKALGISRGSVYYQPRPVSVADLALMRRIDELHLDYPFAGSRMLKGLESVQEFLLALTETNLEQLFCRIRRRMAGHFRRILQIRGLN